MIAKAERWRARADAHALRRWLRRRHTTAGERRELQRQSHPDDARLQAKPRVLRCGVLGVADKKPGAFHAFEGVRGKHRRSRPAGCGGRVGRRGPRSAARSSWWCMRPAVRVWLAQAFRRHGHVAAGAAGARLVSGPLSEWAIAPTAALSSFGSTINRALSASLSSRFLW